MQSPFAVLALKGRTVNGHGFSTHGKESHPDFVLRPQRGRPIAPGNEMLFIEFRARFDQTAPCLLVDPFRVQTF